MLKQLFLFSIFFLSSFSQDGFVLNSPASYKIGSDDITMNINLWGHVQKPGSYDIPIGMGMLELISNAGGPASSANIHDVKIVRKNGEIIVVNIKKYIESGDYSIIKQLQPGDLVIIGGSLNNAVRDFFGYMRDFGVLLNAIILADRL